MKELRKILIGIDKDQREDDNGWWETSCGAEFGAKKLKEVEELFKKLTLTSVVISTNIDEVKTLGKEDTMQAEIQEGFQVCRKSTMIRFDTKKGEWVEE